MKTTILCFLLCLMHRVVLADKEVSCESIQDYFWGYGTQKTCNMKISTTIDSTRFTISPDDATVGGLNFYGNKKIRFLPEYPAKKFPNLVVYRARACSIGKVVKTNFENLSKLRYLDLDTNQLEKIESDTFEDLISLKSLSLSRNRIKFMNGAAFSGLSKLTEVYLGGNICIDETFSTTKILSVMQNVTDKCGFNEASNMKALTDQVNEIAKVVESNKMHQTLAAVSQQSAKILLELQKKSILHKQCHTKGQKLAEEKENLEKEKKECEVEKLNFRDELSVKTSEIEVCRNFEEKFNKLSRNIQDLSFLRNQIEMLEQKTLK